MTTQLDNASIAILIDCYKNCDQSIIENIQKYCIEQDSIKAIFLNSYIEDYILPMDEPFWSNSNTIFNLETKFDELRNQWKNAKFGENSPTHKQMLEPWSRPDQLLLTAFSSLQILYYCNYVNPSIDKIYFFGQAWDMCVKFRPTGWLQINALNYHNMFKTKKTLLSKPECIRFKRSVSYCFDDSWQKLSNGDYRLVKDVWQ